MQAFRDLMQSVFGPIINGARFLMLLWFGGIMLFGFVTTYLSSTGALFGDTAEERQQRQERRMADERAEDQRKSRDARKRVMNEHGWGNDAASASTSTLPQSESRSDRRRNLREDREARAAGWGN